MTEFKKTISLICVSFLIIGSCNDVSNKNDYMNQTANFEVAREFIKAFYSFNEDTMQSTLMYADDTRHCIRYYRKWEECGKCKVVKHESSKSKGHQLIMYKI